MLARSFIPLGFVLGLLTSGCAGTGNDEVCECWSYSTCQDGVVTLFLPSCECGKPTKVVENAYECERGCRTDGSDAFAQDARYACEEWRDKAPGDPCASRRDCLPASFGTYLACDPATEQCVETEPPTIPDYLETCGVTDEDVKYPYSGYFGFVPSDGCEGGLCMVAGGQGCIRQGCTTPCEFPQDCPTGSRCDLHRDHSAFKLRFEVRGVCALEHAVNEGLECPSE